MKYKVSLIAVVLVTLVGQGLSQTASDERITEDEFMSGAPAYVSYYGDTKCTNIISSSAGSSAMDIGLPNYICDSLQVPGSWQNPGANSEEYDLAIIGGGASGVYMANRLIQEFEKNNQPIPKIALFERTQWIGGRLMSARAAGGLGLAVNGNDKDSIDFPPQEYGGMRIDPYRYRLVFDKIIETGKALYGDDKCLSSAECTEESKNCCPDMLHRMEVGNIRYATTRKDLGILGNSSVFTPSQVYSVVNDRANAGILEESVGSGKGSPYDNCIQLPLVAGEYSKSIEKPPVLWKDLVVDMCDNCQQAMPGACDLCEKFPGDSKINGPISCLGYDFPVGSFPSEAMLGLLKEVTNADLGTHLYLIKEGLQRFLQGLLYKNDTIQVAPVFNKQLTSIGLETGVDAQALSAKQVESIDYDKPMKPEIPSPTTLSLGFADGSVVRAKSAVLTMLPFDLQQIDGLEPWNETLYEIISPGQAVKLVLGWENAEDAPEAKLGISSCVSGSCQRVILDGNATDDWMVRQFWLWGPKTAMIYDVAPGNLSDTNKYPASNMMNYAKADGMGAMIQKVMDQINEATGADIPMPTWARIKPWPRGNLNPNWQRGVAFENAATYLERPLGGEVPVFYANSEAAPRGDLHGWIQGGWEMVEDSLPEIAKYLGLTKDLERYNPEDYEKPLRSGAPGEISNPSSQTTSHAGRASASIAAFFGLLWYWCAVEIIMIYGILHVHRSADEATIKRSHRKLAIKMHPDKLQGTEEEKAKAAEKFAEVGHAYGVSMDPKKRQVYDRYGEEGLKSMGDGGGGGGMDPNDIFSQFFGSAFSGFGFGGAQEEVEVKGETVHVGLEVTLEDMYNGREFKITRDKNVLNPARGKRGCNCEQKLVAKSIGPGMFQQFTKTECEKCDNVQFVRQGEELTVSLEPGMVDGQKIEFFEEGEPVIDGEPDDLVLVVQTRPHAVFKRLNTHDLHMNLVISLLEALVGFERQIKNLDGHAVTIAHKGVVSPGDVMKLKNEGMPKYDSTKKGSLYVNITVSFPKSMTDADKKAVKKVFGQASWKHDEL